MFTCDECDQTRYSYHSCKNRHCPKCKTRPGSSGWSNNKPCSAGAYIYMVTFTYRKDCEPGPQSSARCMTYCFKLAAALQQLAQDPRFVGGQIGFWACCKPGPVTALSSPHPLPRPGGDCPRWSNLAARPQRLLRPG
jgi:hypothetical protein